MTEFDIADELRCSVLDLPRVPVYRQYQAYVRMKARHDARMALSKQHKCSPREILFFGEKP